MAARRRRRRARIGRVVRQVRRRDRLNRRRPRPRPRTRAAPFCVVSIAVDVREPVVAGRVKVAHRTRRDAVDVGVVLVNARRVRTALWRPALGRRERAIHTRSAHLPTGFDSAHAVTDAVRAVPDVVRAVRRCVRTLRQIPRPVCARRSAAGRLGCCRVPTLLLSPTRPLRATAGLADTISGSAVMADRLASQAFAAAGAASELVLFGALAAASAPTLRARRADSTRGAARAASRAQSCTSRAVRAWGAVAAARQRLARVPSRRA